MRDTARELRDKKRVLAALVVHDLRSPLSAVGGCLEMMRAELGPDADERVTRYLDDANTLLQKALGLVATILDVDELEDGILHAQYQPTRIVELVDRARAGNRAHEEVRQLRIDVDVAPDLVVPLDRDLCARVVENLLENGMRYAPRGGRCAVSARRDGDVVEIAVGNDGPPVPLAERETIFGRYYQVEARRAAARANRGLGLYFCKLAVDAHRGTIHVEERGELNTVFVVRLPIDAAATAATATAT